MPGTRRRAEALAMELGGRVQETPAGPLLVVETEVDLPLERHRLAGLPFAGISGGPLVCLDLETTGLGTGSGTLAFLVGLGIWHGSRLMVRQYVLPDHADEEALLAALRTTITDDACLVTYSGRSFDWPLLVTRFRLHRRDPPLPASHLDLLPIARQLWRHRLGNARLATIEAAVCGVERQDDLPGALIPERYFGYLRLRRGEVLRAVVEHNRQDIISMGQLLQVLSVQLSARGDRQAAHPGDLAGLARAYARRGSHADALACLEIALASPAWANGIEGGGALYRRLATDRAKTLARLGRRTDALVAWRALAERGGPGAALAWLRVASHKEHFERDLQAALDACRQAADVCSKARSWGRPLHAAERDLARRSARLHRRLAAVRFRPGRRTRDSPCRSLPA
ncbi:hypothetical protein BH24CHL6_BH24CHL6_01450 [soil metagenome]